MNTKIGLEGQSISIIWWESHLHIASKNTLVKANYDSTHFIREEIVVEECELKTQTKSL